MADIHILPANGEAVAYPEEHIPNLLRSGRISTEALYWREGMTDWQPIATYRAAVRSSTRRTEPVPIKAVVAKTPAYPRVALTANGNGTRRAEPAPSPLAPARRPVQGELAAADSPPRSKRTSGRSLIRFRRNPWPTTIALGLWLVLCLGIALVELVHGIADYQRQSAGRAAIAPAAQLAPPQAKAPPGSKAAKLEGTKAFAADDTPITRGELLKWSGWTANLLLLLPYFIWLYRTAINCRFFSPMMRLKTRLAIGCYFIPFLNLFRPCQDMQEIWRVSGNPRGWLNDRGSALVVLWWVLSLVTIGVAIENSTLFVTAETHEDAVFASLFYVIKKCVQIAWYLSFLALVALILRRQTRAVARDRSRSQSRVH